MALQLLHGDIDQLKREYMGLFTPGVCVTKKLGFSDIIMPGRTFQNLLAFLAFFSRMLLFALHNNILEVYPFGTLSLYISKAKYKVVNQNT